MTTKARSLIPRETIDRVLDRTDLVALVAQRVVLKRSGTREWKGRSPFVDEKTPSFFVNPQKRVWNCFASGKAGNAISFVMALDGLSFREAVEQLARDAGIVLD